MEIGEGSVSKKEKGPLSSFLDSSFPITMGAGSMFLDSGCKVVTGTVSFLQGRGECDVFEGSGLGLYRVGLLVCRGMCREGGRKG